MKKFIYSLLLCSSLTFALSAAEPEISHLATFDEVLQELNSYHPTYLDLRIAKANGLLNSGKYCEGQSNHSYNLYGSCSAPSPSSKFRYRDKPCGLKYIFGGDFSYDDSLNKIVCNVDCGWEFISNNFDSKEKAELAYEIYKSVKKLAKECINPRLNDQNIIVILNLTKTIQDSQIIEIERAPIARWEKGRAVYYEKFIKNLSP
jgi:hypothetical protein